MMSKEICTYSLDKDDVITDVGSNWTAFAEENDGVELSPGTVVGRSLWEFVQDFDTRHLYERVFGTVRTGKSVGPIPFRCDAPDLRRVLELRLNPLADGGIEIVSTIVKTEPREPLELLERDAERSDHELRLCSMCKKMATSQNTWLELEEGLVHLKPFEIDPVPQLINAVCPECYRSVMADLDGSDGPADPKEKA